METTQPIALSGTSHIRNAQQGSLAHAVNVRPERGVLKAITQKESLLVDDGFGNIINMPPSWHKYDIHFLHKNAEFHHWIGVTASGSVEWFNEATGAVISVIGVVPNIKEILSLKNIILLITDEGIVKYLYVVASSNYRVIDVWKASFPAVSLGQKTYVNTLGYTMPIDGKLTAQFNVDTTTAALIDAMYKIENEQADQGKMIGLMWYRFAYRLYDGSHIFPSCPKLTDGFNVINEQWIISGAVATDYQAMFHQIIIGHSGGNVATARVWFSDLVCNYQPADFMLPDGLKDIIVGIDIYASKPVRPYKLDSESITITMMQELGSNHLDQFRNVSEFAPVDIAINSQDVDNWYLIQKYSISDLTTGTTKDINLKGYWNNWSSRETLTKDTGSWHSMHGKTGLVYNSRLMLGDISTKLLETYPTVPVNLSDVNNEHKGVSVGDIVYRDAVATTVKLELKIVTRLNTDDGEVYVINDSIYQEVPLLAKYVKATSGYTYVPGSTTKMIILPGTISYPDFRAKEIQLVVKDGSGIWRLLDTVKPLSATNNNFAFSNSVDYTVSKEFRQTNTIRHQWRELVVSVDSSNALTALPVYNFPRTTNDIQSDQNRVIVSGLNNPITYEASNSYRVGNGRIVAIGANGRAINEGQFGEHPVIVFTTEGIYAMGQGNFPVLFQTVSPVAGDVCLSPHLLTLRNSIVFLGERGVTLLQGQDTVVLSEILDGTAFNPLNGLNNYDQITTNPLLFNSKPIIIASTDIRTYIDSTTCLGYDHKRDELIVFTPGKLYSWIFSLTDKVWYKCSQNWKSVINSWPDSYVQDTTGHILDLTLESKTATAEVMIQTNPIKMGGYVGYDLLELEGNIAPASGKYTGIYLYGAEREDNYFLLGGNQMNQLVRNYKSNTFSRMKVNDIILIITTITNSESFLVPRLNLSIKPKFNQIKS